VQGYGCEAMVDSGSMITAPTSIYLRASAIAASVCSFGASAPPIRRVSVPERLGGAALEELRRSGISGARASHISTRQTQVNNKYPTAVCSKVLIFHPAILFGADLSSETRTSGNDTFRSGLGS
jgi:hypothetical protein